MKSKQKRHKALTRKKARKQIERTLADILVNLKSALGEKKFRQRIKKAGKLLSNGFPKSIKNKNKQSRETLHEITEERPFQ